jgi:hypothetical protein
MDSDTLTGQPPRRSPATRLERLCTDLDQGCPRLPERHSRDGEFGGLQTQAGFNRGYGRITKRVQGDLDPLF